LFWASLITFLLTGLFAGGRGEFHGGTGYGVFAHPGAIEFYPYDAACRLRRAGPAAKFYFERTMDRPKRTKTRPKP